MIPYSALLLTTAALATAPAAMSGIEPPPVLSPVLISGLLFAGLGLFFIGMRLISNNLKQMTGRTFRRLIARTTQGKLLAPITGMLAGALTQSTNAITFISISLITAGMIPVRKALPIVTWANVGTSVLVLLATVNIKAVILYLLGVTGIGYYLELDKSQRFHHLLGVLLGLGLLFFGLVQMKDGAAELRQLEAVRAVILLAADSYFLLFSVGTVLAMVTQSSATITIIAIALTAAGLLNENQVIMMVYGASLGSGVAVWFLSSNLRGTANQLIQFQILFKTVGALVFVVLFYLELYGNTPLVKAGAAWLAEHTVAANVDQRDFIARQVAWIFALLQIASALIMTILMGVIARVLAKLSPPTTEEVLAKPKFIYDQALGEPESALDLVEKEQTRLLGFLPYYLDSATEHHVQDTQNHSLSTAVNPNAVSRSVLHGAGQSVAQEIEHFVTELLSERLDHTVLQQVINYQSRNARLVELQDTLDKLAHCIEQTNAGAEERTCRIRENLTEGLHAVLVTLADACETLDDFDLQALHAMTSDRPELMERIRKNLLDDDKPITFAHHEALFEATVLFERAIWLIRRYTLLVTEASQPR